jgi:hypothetical protein
VEGAKITLMNKFAEHPMLPWELETGCQLHFRFRSYGGKTLPGSLEQVEGAQIDKKLMSKTVQHLMLPLALKIGCRLRSYGGKTLPGSSKLVEGAEIAHKFMKQICRAPHATHWIEKQMSVALPVPHYEHISDFSKSRLPPLPR